MAGQFQEQLAAALPRARQQLVFFEEGSIPLAYNKRNLLETLQEFCAVILPQSPFRDPRGEIVKLVKSNFPKLVDLEHKTLSRREFPAREIVRSIEEGTFEWDHYHECDSSRLKTLFWLPEMVLDPDAIFKNGHKIIAGDEIYVRVYNKQGSKVKLFFILKERDKRTGKVLFRVPVTSFLTDSEMAVKFIDGQPLYVRPKEIQPPGGG